MKTDKAGPLLARGVQRWPVGLCTRAPLAGSGLCLFIVARFISVGIENQITVILDTSISLMRIYCISFSLHAGHEVLS